MYHLLVLPVLTALVEDAEHLVQAVVDLSVQTGNLHDDTVVCQAVDKGIGQPPRNNVVVIVVGVAAHIEHRLLDVAHLMAQEINGNHGDGVAFGRVWHQVFRVGIVYA